MDSCEDFKVYQKNLNISHANSVSNTNLISTTVYSTVSSATATTATQNFYAATNTSSLSNINTQLSSSATKLYSNSSLPSNYHHNFNTISKFSFNSTSASIFKRISKKLERCMSIILKLSFHLFLLLCSSNCILSVVSTSSALETGQHFNLTLATLQQQQQQQQLPIQAHILENSTYFDNTGNTTAYSIQQQQQQQHSVLNDGSSNGSSISGGGSNDSSYRNSDTKNLFEIAFTTLSSSIVAAAAYTDTATASFSNSNNFTTTMSSLSSPNSTTDDEMLAEFNMPPVTTILISIVLLCVILGTIIGNILVCIAVCMVRKLRRPCNYLLVSLALSDLCVAVLVMPMALLYEVFEKWNFGILMCDIWVSFDVLCCTASILNLCAISVDRYLAITKPLEYGVKRTPRRMMLCVGLVWLAAACISLPPLLILGNEHVGENGDPMCSVCQNFAYQIYATLGSFYIPLAVMLFVYYQIFRAARRIVLEEKRAQTHLQHALNGTASPPVQTDLTTGYGGNGQHRHSSYGNTSLNYSTCGGLSVSQGACGGGGGSGSSGLLGSPHQKKLRFQLAKEKKASTTLGIIMSAFTICWLPFFILALIRPFVESETTHVPQTLSSLFLWLGYANSLLNPIIYATLNRDFRKPFQEILYFRCSSLNTMMRENYYHDQYGEPPSQRVMLGDEKHGARESFL